VTKKEIIKALTDCNWTDIKVGKRKVSARLSEMGRITWCRLSLEDHFAVGTSAAGCSHWDKTCKGLTLYIPTGE
jgi:hypothetical protein